MAANLIQTSFNGGELSRRLDGRVDTAIYAIGASEITNMVATSEGPLVKRSGTKAIATALASTAWLTPFVFNVTQSYILAWSALAVRFFTNDAPLSVAGVPVEVTTPYSATQVADIDWVQSNDVIYLCHPSHPSPATLSRTAADAFTYAVPTLSGGPFKDGNTDESVTVTASGVVGSITLTAAAAIFSPGHVGGLFKLECEDFSDIKAWEPGYDGVAVSDVRRSDGKAYVAETAGKTGSVQPTHTSGAEWDGTVTGNDNNGDGAGGIRWRYRHDRFGIARITATGSPSVPSATATATVLRRMPSSLTSVASWRWAHGAFSAAEGWPSLVALWNSRLILVKGNELHGSVVGSYRDFSERNSSGQLSADQAFRLRLPNPNRILWLVADRQLLFGTAFREYAVAPLNGGEAPSGTNLGVSEQSFYGSDAVKPLQAGTRTLFVQRGGRKLRAADYQFGKDRYAAANLNAWSRHITAGGLIQLAPQGNPDELVWMVTGQGAALAHTDVEEQDVKAITRGIVMPGASVLSAVGIPSTDGSRDDLWLLVDRGGVRTVEQLQPAWDESDGRTIADAYFVDGGIAYAGAPASVFGGLTHLAGMAVVALADGEVIDGLSVTGGGTVTLPHAASKVAIGRPYTARVTTLRPEIPKRDGTSQGRRKRIVKLIARLIDSAAIYAGDLGGKLDAMLRRPTDTPMGAPTPLYNGDTNEVSVGGGWTTDGRVTLESPLPLPWILNALMPRIEEGDA